MSNQFPIFKVPDNAAQAAEAMGTKFKFWFHHSDLGNCLFKRSRPNTGEDWSEKTAAELAQLLGLPHARQELAVWKGQPGTSSPTMVPTNAALIHGNDILAAGSIASYPRTQRYSVSEHTLDVVLQAISRLSVSRPVNWTPPNGITTAMDTFVGYLLLDAWIGNSDRHHENWGFIMTIDPTAQLAPTYDHASCLGRELLDSNRQQRLQNNSVEAYIDRARSAFYAQSGDKKALLTIDAFRLAAQQFSKSANVWLNQLDSIAETQPKEILNRIPPARISPVAIEFAHQALKINKRKLLNLREAIL